MKSPFRPVLVVFLLVFALGLAWALFTQHIWEDYYITFRASKNLATGQGLTFTSGERVHSFTSPLGVLLPAAASLVTGNNSEAAALWVFRLLSLSALAGAAALLWQTVRRLHPDGAAPAVLLVALFATDNKIVDYSINGMETAFLLLFVAWALRILLTGATRAVLHLGLAWAGMMWTRPDAAIYIAAMAAGLLLFQPGRWARLKLFAGAGAVCATLYLPWFLWAWSYYGSPLPHTITAKGLFLDRSLPALLSGLAKLPAVLLQGGSFLEATFMPAYGFSSIWPLWASRIAYLFAAPIALIWALPVVRWEARFCSFLFLTGHLYLALMVGFPVPWYLPIITLFGLLVIVFVFGDGLSLHRRLQAATPASNRLPALRSCLLGGAALLVILSGVLALCTAYHFRVQQRLIEVGNRQEIGRWLRQNAGSPQETVFLEPLGYIGYFSGLKMLDYPGLSSPEVVAARRRTKQTSSPDCWPELIRDLRPDWLVLRLGESAIIRRDDFDLLPTFYDLVRTFDVRARVDAIKFLPGRGYLTGDAAFEVYRLKPAIKNPGVTLASRVHRLTLSDFTRLAALTEVRLSEGRFDAHAPSSLVYRLPTGATALLGKFGILPDAYANPPNATDGAIFSIDYVPANGPRQSLLLRPLDPVNVAADRQAIAFHLPLLPNMSGSIEFSISPGPHESASYDWTYWSELRVEISGGN